MVLNGIAFIIQQTFTDTYQAPRIVLGTKETYPMTDTRGRRLTGKLFTITNLTRFTAHYQLV